LYETEVIPLIQRSVRSLDFCLRQAAIINTYDNNCKDEIKRFCELADSVLCVDF